MNVISSDAQVIIKDSNGSSGVNIWSALGGHAAVLNFWGHGAYLARGRGCNEWHILILPSGEWENDIKSEGFEIVGKLFDLTQAAQKAMTKTPQEKHAQGYAYSKCCQAPTTTAGHKSPGSTCWYVCTDCCTPCDIFFKANETTEP